MVECQSRATPVQATIVGTSSARPSASSPLTSQTMASLAERSKVELALGFHPSALDLAANVTALLGLDHDQVSAHVRVIGAMEWIRTWLLGGGEGGLRIGPHVDVEAARGIGGDCVLS